MRDVDPITPLIAGLSVAGVGASLNLAVRLWCKQRDYLDVLRREA